ncbi:MAG: ABC transporter [candidate division Zixibacteria bacterium SM23_73_2]|nr:MAG: ABC transporter [candidate division Zixibacteria bacterium SM23_73_2]
MAQNIWTICKKEFKSYFNSPAAYIILTLFLLLCGWFFFSDFFIVNQANLRGLFGIAPFIFMFFAPAITMRLIAEEKRAGTIEVLVTLPIKDSEIILGKFLAAFFLLSIAVLLTVFYPLTLSGSGNFDFGSIFGGYLGLILTGCCFLSVGLFSSSLTQNQIVAFILGFVIIFTLMLLDKVLFFFPGILGSVFQYLSVSYHSSNLARGVIDSRDLIYYFSIVFFFLLLAVKAMESRRWR